MSGKKEICQYIWFFHGAIHVLSFKLCYFWWLCDP